MHIIAQTARFFIRDFKPEDEDIYLSLFDDERVNPHLPSRTRKEHSEVFKKALEDHAENKALGRWGVFNDIELMGMCMLRNYNDDEYGKMELGYALRQKYWGKGIAAEMAIIMVNYAFNHAYIKEIVGVTTLGNIGSQKVLEKAGLIRMDNIKRDGEELTFFSIKR